MHRIFSFSFLLFQQQKKHFMQYSLVKHEELFMNKKIQNAFIYRSSSRYIIIFLHVFMINARIEVADRFREIYK